VSRPVTIEVLATSVRGAAHLRAGRPNEDAAAAGRSPAIVAVADGHGSESCPRAREGAELAVLAAIDALKALHGPTPHESTPHEPTPHESTPHESTPHESTLPDPETLDALPSAIVARWRAAVTAHEALDPTGEAEPHRLYGTTLIAAMVTPTWMVALQVGDGDVLVIECGNADVVSPVPTDDRLLGNDTTSLSFEDAALDFRLMARLGPPPQCLLVATDGYANSFRDRAGFLRVPADLLTALREDGTDRVQDALPHWLDETSAEGSGDDISVGIIWTREVT